MALTRVTLNRRGIREVLRSEGVRKALRGASAGVLAEAQATAPVETGAYRDGLTTWDDTTDRAVVRVGSTVPYAAVVEASTGNLVRAAGGIR